MAPTLIVQPLAILPGNLSGTWPQDAGRTLKIDFAGKSYALGSDAALTSDAAGNWSLQVPAGLADGTYDVAVQALDSAGQEIAAAVTAKVVVDAAPPSNPTVMLYEGADSPTVLRGTWAEGDATQLTVTVPKANIAATLGEAGSAMVSDGAGTWTLALTKSLEPGDYDVVVQSIDAQGRMSTDLTGNEVHIVAQTTSPPPPPVAEQPVEPPPPPPPPPPSTILRHLHHHLHHLPPPRHLLLLRHHRSRNNPWNRPTIVLVNSRKWRRSIRCGSTSIMMGCGRWPSQTLSHMRACSPIRVA